MTTNSDPVASRKTWHQKWGMDIPKQPNLNWIYTLLTEEAFMAENGLTNKGDK